MGQKRSRAGRGKRRAGHFPRSGTKLRPESEPGLIVGQPRRNAPFLTHGERWIPYGGIRRRDPQRTERTRFPAGAPAAHGQKGHSSRAAGVPGRRHEDGGSLHALWGVQRSTIIAATTGCPVCPGCGHPGTSTSVNREAAWVQSLEISVPGLPLAGRVVIAPASAWGWRLGLCYGGD